MVNGTLYFTAGTQRWVVAADALTGATSGRGTWTKATAAAGRRGGTPDAAYRSGPTAARTASGCGFSPSRPASCSPRSTRRPACRCRSFGTTRPRRSEGAARRTVDLLTARDRLQLAAARLRQHRRHPAGAAGGLAAAVDEERARPDSRVRCAHRQAAWRFNTIPLKGEFGYETWEKGSAEYTGQRRGRGRRSPRTRSAATSICRSKPRPATTTAGTARATISSRRRSSASTPERASACGTSNSSTTTSGIATTRRTDPCGHHRERQADRSRRAADEAGVRVRLRSRDGRARLADQRAAGAEQSRRAGRDGVARRSRFRRSRRPFDRQGVDARTISSTSRRRSAPRP